VAFFLVCNGLALLNMAVTVYSLLPILRENELGKWILPFQNRWFYLSLTAVFLSTLIVVATLFRHHLIQAVLALALIVFVIGIKRDVLAEYRHYITTPEESFSQWSVYAPLTEQPDYAIPLNPHPWMLLHHTVELGDVASENGAFVLETSEPPLVRSAVVLESSPELEKTYELIAIDRNGNELAIARQLIPAGYEHPYFYFERGVRTARFKLVDDASQPVAGSLTIRFMGPADPR
jgi:hypothetical protein